VIVTINNCRWCGQAHGPLCPRVKAYEFFRAAPETVKRVEFFAPTDYHLAEVVAAPAPPALRATTTLWPEVDKSA
jgi:hypothetical protein